MFLFPVSEIPHSLHFRFYFLNIYAQFLVSQVYFWQELICYELNCLRIFIQWFFQFFIFVPFAFDVTIALFKIYVKKHLKLSTDTIRINNLLSFIHSPSLFNSLFLSFFLILYSIVLHLKFFLNVSVCFLSFYLKFKYRTVLIKKFRSRKKRRRKKFKESSEKSKLREIPRSSTSWCRVKRKKLFFRSATWSAIKIKDN